MLIHGNGWIHPNFSPDGVEGGGSEASSSSEQTEGAQGTQESSSSDVKKDVASEKVATHDEKGVPYYNRYREAEAKYKDVDLDKWKELSSIDLKSYKAEKEWIDMLLKEKELYDQVMGVIQGYKKPAAAPGKQTVDPEILKRMEELESWKSSTEQERHEIVAEKVRAEYDTRYNKELDVSLKTTGIKSLTSIEKQWLRSSVDEEYRRDWQESQQSKSQPKLGWNELPGIVKKHMTAVDSARRESLKGAVRKDGSPDAISGGGLNQFSQKPDLRNESKAQRVQRIATEMKDAESFRPA
jgi:hypothetical protein